MRLVPTLLASTLGIALFSSAACGGGGRDDGFGEGADASSGGTSSGGGSTPDGGGGFDPVDAGVDPHRVVRHGVEEVICEGSGERPGHPRRPAAEGGRGHDAYHEHQSHVGVAELGSQRHKCGGKCHQRHAADEPGDERIDGLRPCRCHGLGLRR